MSGYESNGMKEVVKRFTSAAAPAAVGVRATMTWGPKNAQAVRLVYLKVGEQENTVTTLYLEPGADMYAEAARFGASVKEEASR